MHIDLIGDSSHGIDALAQMLGKNQVATKVAGEPCDDALILVAVSCREGLSENSLSVLSRWNGQHVYLLGVVLTDTGPDVDPELMEMVFYETCNHLLPHAEQESIANNLPVLYDSTPNLAKQVQKLAETLPPKILMSSDKKAFGQYVQGFEDREKPWWKFW